MLDNAFTFHVQGADEVFTKTFLGANTSTYSNADGTATLVVKQTTSKDRFRREFRFTRTKIAADPVSAINKAAGVSVYAVVDEPKYGFSDTELLELALALSNTLNNTALMTSVLQGQY